MKSYYFYSAWNALLLTLSLSLSVFAVKLPGRESRAKEPFFQNMQQIVDEVVGVLLPLLKEKPFALFGHRYENNKCIIKRISNMKSDLIIQHCFIACILFVSKVFYISDLSQLWCFYELRSCRCSEESPQPRTSSRFPVWCFCSLRKWLLSTLFDFCFSDFCF